MSVFFLFCVCVYAQASKDTPSARATQLGPQTLVNLFNSPLYSDVIFMVQGSVLPAHRAVLVARCDVMAAMFSGKYAEARSRVVPIHGVSSDTFLSFLEYLYTDSCCPASVLQAMSVLMCAEMYQVKRLQHLCEVCVCAYLQSMPSRELASTGLSVVRLLRKAKCHNAEQLYVWLLHFIANNYLIFSHKHDFLELSDEECEQVERLRWPSRGYLQELSEYQQRRRKLRKSRCTVM
uniref:Rho related BTB domain containing 3 n=1 Tax=Cynoglossus semilaevis TaxID=244447 RepID=A0A3P8W4X0_CYNSE